MVIELITRDVMKNQVTENLIADLRKKGFEKQALFKSLAKGVSKPRRSRYEVNLSRIEKHAKANETVIVPGVVLGTGDLNKKVNVAAYRFSDSAKTKIEKSGGKCLTLDEFSESYRKGTKIRIMG